MANVMNEIRPPLSETDYEAIEAAVMETERGRWFLAEYAARNRNSDTNVLLEAIKKLERSLMSGGAGASAPTADQIRFDLVEMAAAIAQTKREIAALRADDDQSEGIMAATEELDAIVVATETATQAILEAAEHIQEVTWTMRENGVAEDYCDSVENQVTEIYTSCSFQDITGQRTSKVVAVLHYLEQRLEAMRHIWGGDEVEPQAPSENTDTRPDSHLLNGPQHEGEGHDQGDVDLMMSSQDELYAAVVSPADAGHQAVITDPVLDDETTADLDFVEQGDGGDKDALEDEILFIEPASEEGGKDDAASTMEYDVTAAAKAIIAEAVAVEEDKDEESDYEIVETVSEPQFLAQGPADNVRPTDLNDEDKLALFS